MTLHDYARIEGVSYRTALRRFQAGEIPGAYRDEASGRVVIEIREQGGTT